MKRCNTCSIGIECELQSCVQQEYNIDLLITREFKQLELAFMNSAQLNWLLACLSFTSKYIVALVSVLAFSWKWYGSHPALASNNFWTLSFSQFLNTIRNPFPLWLEARLVTEIIWTKFYQSHACLTESYVSNCMSYFFYQRCWTFACNNIAFLIVILMV